MDGTAHLILSGDSPSGAPWPLVKDLGEAGRIYRDGELVYERGAWDP
jgi:hypothetical protein